MEGYVLNVYRILIVANSEYGIINKINNNGGFL